MRQSVLSDSQAQFLRDEKETLAGIQLALAKLDLPREALASLQKAILQLDELFLIVIAGEFNAGKSALVSWQVRNAQSCSALGGPTGWAGADISVPQGLLELKVTEPGCYTLVLRCEDGVNTVEENLNLEIRDADVIFRNGFEAPCVVQ